MEDVRAAIVAAAAAGALAGALAVTAAWVLASGGGHARADREPLTVRRTGVVCGVERWAVKTLADGRAGEVRFGTVVPTNIARLSALPTDTPTLREAPTETTVWELARTHVVAFKLEGDSDLHLELRSPLPGNPTMIAEMPNPACVTAGGTAAARAQQARAGAARAAFLSYLAARGLSARTTWQSIDQEALLDGVGFLDRDHGQRGVAANAVELHPVLRFAPR